MIRYKNDSPVKKIIYITILALGIALCTSCNTQQAEKNSAANNLDFDSMKKSFVSPPDSVIPGVYWWWFFIALIEKGLAKA